MLWIFVIIGSLTLVSVLIRSIDVYSRKHSRGGPDAPGSALRQQSALDHPAILACQFVLLGAAYTQSPREPLAWVALLAAFGIQLLRWATRVAGGQTMPESPEAPVSPSVTDIRERAREETRSQEEVSAARVPEVEPTVHEPAISDDGLGRQMVAGPENRDDPAATEGPEPALTECPAPVGSPPAESPPEEAAPIPRVFTTFVILRGPWRPVAEVVIAALRRAGQRDAVLLRTETGSRQVAVQAGVIRLEITAVEEQVAPWALEPALENHEALPDGGEAMRSHPWHARLVTQSPPEVPPVEVVRLHHRAHAALSEFAPVEASLWPDASCLTPAAGLPGLARDAADRCAPIQSCVSIRRWRNDQSQAAEVLLDTVGLHAFGLPDLEWIVPADAADASAEELSAMAERLFIGDWVAAEGRAQEFGGGSFWNVALSEASRPPSRYVARIERIRNEGFPAGGE